MGSAAPLIRKGRKYDQVLEGARSVFLRDGFEGASVDDIAAAAEVSKATLYSYFPDKRLLFMEVAKAECLRQADEALAVIDDAAPVTEVLMRSGQRITSFILSEFGQRVYRICVAESDRFPGLGKEFYESGPLLLRERLVNYLRVAADRGEVSIDDLALAADQFVQLCKADLHDKLIFGIGRKLTETDLDRVVQGAVGMFMARYGSRQD